MNLDKLFKIQAELDNRIVEKKGLQGQDLLDKKILALQVELGELAQNWRGFKFWSEDQEPRGQAEYLEYRCTCEGGNRWVNKNPLLEEYVDCLHFILSIGNDLILYKYEYVELVDFTNDIIAQFNAVFRLIGNWKKEQLLMNNRFYFEVVNEFLCLGKMLGFTWEQIETAYLEKNKINHERQENGY